MKLVRLYFGLLRLRSRRKKLFFLRNSMVHAIATFRDGYTLTVKIRDRELVIFANDRGQIVGMPTSGYSTIR